MGFRNLISQIWSRARLANVAGHTYRGERDLYKALGYQRQLFIQDYWSRFLRNGVANRIVKALPKATWRGGAELIEDDDPTVNTPFEEAFDALNDRLKIWPRLAQTDILAGIGRFGVLVLGAPGNTETPLLRCKPEELVYLKPYSELDVKIFKWDLDIASPRYGKPLMYTLSRVQPFPDGAVNSNTTSKNFHWTRVLHVTDDLLDDENYSEPRLQAPWNFIDDLEKVSGGGAEAFWRRADRGIQFDLDPTIEFEEEEEGEGPQTGKNDKAVKSMKKQIDEYEHGLRRYLLTRGVTMNEMGSDVADFLNPIMSIMSLISASTGIPQRVLMGSEQGKLAAKMDRSNWDDRVADRRDDLAGPLIVRPFIDRLIGLGVLPTPQQYSVRWPQLKILDDEQRATIAGEWASLNKNMNETVVTPDEIREYVLDLPKLADVTASVVPPLGAKKFLRKWAVLSHDKRRYYGARFRAMSAAANPNLETLLSAAVTTGRRMLAARPELREAIAKNDRPAIERLMNEAADLVERELDGSVPKALTE